MTQEFTGLKYDGRSWWRKLMDLVLGREFAAPQIASSRYAPGSQIEGTPISYEELEQTYEGASWGSGEPNLGVSSLDAMIRWCAARKGISYAEARESIIANSELVEIEGLGEVYSLSNEGTKLLMFGDAD